MVEVTPRGTRGRGFPAFARWLMGRVIGVSVLAYHAFGDRMRVQGRPLLMLNTVGARSGRVRHTILCWFPDERPDSYIVTATNAGSASHPAWFLNMARHPDDVSIEIGGRVIRVRPESVPAPEREAAWRRIVALAPGYGAYGSSTDREIPVVRLIPISS